MDNPLLSQNAVTVLESRYLKRDEQRRIIETPQQLFERVARSIAHAELLLGNAKEAVYWEEQFLGLLQSLDFLPNSPTLMNASTPLGQLSACFVLPVDDTTEGIFEAVKQMALVQRTGGGTGFSFSHLRPKGDIVASTAGEASGPVSFMSIFDCTTEHIKQGGKRRGANMGVLRVDHPDIMDFVEAKRNEPAFRNFNLSVLVTDAFMEAVRSRNFFDLINPRTGEKSGSLNAAELFDATAREAWQTGDPGLIFFDAVQRANPTPHVGTIEATNPCGEIPLLPYESCNLGSINLPHMLREKDGGLVMDWEKLRATTRTAVRFLDDVIEVNRYPVPEIEKMTRGNRKIGLGLMGFSDMLIGLGIPYDSREALQLAGEIMETIASEAHGASQQLAAERGPFDFWKGSTHEAGGIRIRNATCTTIAPTGTISIIAGTSPSIEPLFALAYRRSHVLGEQTLIELNPLLGEHLERLGLDVETIADGVRRKGHLKGESGVPEDFKKLFVTALEIPYRRHLEVQAAFQRHVDNSVSKTINMPEEAAVDDVRNAYWLAWELGLKGITIYRYGSKTQQVLELGAGEESYHYDHGSKCDPEECRV